jgi:hypothetical protein
VLRKESDGANTFPAVQNDVGEPVTDTLWAGRPRRYYRVLKTLRRRCAEVAQAQGTEDVSRISFSDSPQGHVRILLTVHIVVEKYPSDARRCVCTVGAGGGEIGRTARYRCW